MIKIKNLTLSTSMPLRNATDVLYSKPVNQIWSAGFSLPLNDPQRQKVQQLHYAEITDRDGEYIGLFRITTRTTDKSAATRTIKYDCAHVLSTLMDSAITGYRQTTKGWTTRQVIEWILSFQKVQNWVLGQCDFANLFEYSFENQNGLADALFSITEPLAEDYMWTWDTTSYPWTINLIKPPTTPTCRIREGWNLDTLTVEENPLKVVNRIYALGKGDGINNVNFKKINGGKDYLDDAESQALYGLIEYIWKDERFINEETLLSSTQAMLDKCKKPIISWKVKALDLIKAIPSHSTIRIPKIDELRVGKVVQLWTSLFGVVNLRIVKESKSDVFGDPGNIELEIGYIGSDITTTLADLQRKFEISQLSSVGATNKDTISFTDNCDASHPLETWFYCETELKKINKVLLTFKAEQYRAYSRANKGGGATVQGGTTSSGGATVQGGTSQSGGGSAETSSSNGNHTHVMFTVASGPAPGHTASVLNAGSGGVVFAETNGASQLVTAGSSGSHSHTVNVPAHTHSFSVNIPNHTHTFNFSLPDHTHEIEYGIWTQTTLPATVILNVDGTDISIEGTSSDRLNITQYLKREEDGTVTRGRHDILIKIPNGLARFTGQCTIYGFIGSTDGEEL